MKILMSFLIVLLCACSRYSDQRVELSDLEAKMATPPCACKIRAQNLALTDDMVYNAN